MLQLRRDKFVINGITASIWLQSKGEVCILLAASKTWLLLIASCCQKLLHLKHQLPATQTDAVSAQADSQQELARWCSWQS